MIRFIYIFFAIFLSIGAFGQDSSTGETTTESCNAMSDNSLPKDAIESTKDKTIQTGSGATVDGAK